MEVQIKSWSAHLQEKRRSQRYSYYAQRTKHSAPTPITRALTASRDSETSTSGRAILYIQTVKVREDKCCYAPLAHRDFSLSPYVRKVCVRYLKEHIKSSHCTVPRYYTEPHLLTFSSITSSNTHKPTAMKNNAFQWSSQWH